MIKSRKTWPFVYVFYRVMSWKHDGLFIWHYWYEHFAHYPVSFQEHRPNIDRLMAIRTINQNRDSYGSGRTMEWEGLFAKQFV